jgi:ectonucleoside triphosphate diphosphohydrolase 5/6
VLLVFALVYYVCLTGNTSVPSHSVNWWDENFHLRFGLQKKTYAVVIDAGSTGSRVSAFEFHQSIKDRNLKLKSQLFEEIKPGLSSYADNPDEGAKRLNGLIQKARDYIPKDKWASTPITLKATAGLRLLPKAKADAILDAVSETIRTSGFKPIENAVGIMDGVDEGIFSWFTVNFLLDRIGGPVSKTVAALDLGGGSTQITVASSVETQGAYHKDDIQNISLFHQNVPLYTHSYLGLGLQSVRKSVLSFNQSDPTSKILASVCVNPAVSRDWAHGGETYTIKGIENGKFEKVQYNGFVRKEPVADWDECYNQIVKLIEDKGVIKSKDLNRQVVLFSYFFERAAEAGLIDPKEGGKLTLQHYFDAGKQACRTVNSDLPLLCLDVTYMGAMLHNGYGLAKHTPLLALKKVNGYEISWALGLAYHILQNE